MSDPSLPLQDAVEAGLRADAVLATDMGGAVILFTMSAPFGTPKPYLVIGNDQIVPDAGADACGAADDAYTKVHIWTRDDEGGIEASRRQAKTLAAHVRRILTTALTVEGFTVVDWACEDVLHLTDPDGLTAHSVVSNRFHLDPA